MVTKLTYVGLVVFFLAAMMAQVSGNDKFPFLIILIFGLNFAMLIINFVRFIRMPSDKTMRINMVLGLFLTLYVVGVIYLSRIGMVDSMMFLGFR